nr:AAA family ATPase [Ferrimicrobium acidiphilum]
MIAKLVLKNFRRFENVVIEFQDGLNVIVGDNEAGKTTLLEAINLALTKRWNGKFFDSEFSHHFITASVVDQYVEGVKVGEAPRPPEVLVEVYLKDAGDLSNLKGTNNSLLENAPGYRLSATLDPDFAEDYEAFLDEPDEVSTVPTEFYKVEWTAFNGQPVNVRTLQVRSSLIDASRIRLSSGTDYHLQKILSETLTPKQRAQLARKYRLNQEQFKTDEAIQKVNEAITAASGTLSHKSLTLEIDTSGANGWESSLSPHLDKLPFHFSGSGEQNRLKILLALSRTVSQSNVILVEEPENHLSFPHLAGLIEQVDSQSEGRQVFIATHSSFVVNKLGLGRLMLLSESGIGRIVDLPAGTQDYFKKLAGYDTLRLVLASKVVLVEGPSDDLIFQRAYLDRKQCLPLENGIDVISVRGLSATRFLDLAIPLQRHSVVLADNDGDYVNKVDARYKLYAEHSFIAIVRSDDDSRPSLEQQLLGACGLDAVNSILEKQYVDEKKLLNYMLANKTDVALKFFEYPGSIVWPAYLEEAIDALEQ